jgi:phage regulator Rha-like protein
MIEIVSQATIESKIWRIRGKKVMLDRDLAELYGVPTKALNQAVKRNLNRFPDEFIFQLTLEEADASRSQNVTLKRGLNIKYLPYAFTEHGVAMLSSVLNSERAVEINILIIKAFIRLHKIVTDHSEIRQSIQNIEKRLNVHDREIQIAFAALKDVLNPPNLPPKKLYSPDGNKKMGFVKAKREN